MNIKPTLPVAKHICTYTQAVQLNGLGVSRATMFYWELLKSDRDQTPKEDLKLYAFLENTTDLIARYPAFMVADLLMIMGPNVAMWREEDMYCCSVNKQHYPLPEIKEGNNFFIVKSASHLAEAVAQMCIVLGENKML